MELTVNTTATSPATVRALAPVPINFNADWRIISEKPGELVLANITDPVLGASQLRYAVSTVSDVFKGTELEAPGASASGTTPSPKGTSILVQLTGSASVEGNTLPKFPYSAHLVLRVPQGAEPDGSDGSVQDIIEYLLGALYETGATDIASKIDALLHGALKPADL